MLTTFANQDINDHILKIRYGMMDCSSSMNYQPSQNEKETSEDLRNTLASLLKKDFLNETDEKKISMR
jgi:hypothetical protein